MRAVLTCLTILASLTAALAQKVLLAPVEVLDGKPFPWWVKDSTQKGIAEAVEQQIGVKFKDAGAQMVKAVQAEKLMTAMKPALSGKPSDAMDFLASAAAEAGVDYVLVVQIARWQQKDRSVSEVLANPGAPQSETKVEVRCWLYDAKSKVLAIDGGGKPKEGVYGGQHIGTQKKDELSGKPEDVIDAMAAVNRRRASYIARAMWSVLKMPLAQATGLILGVK